MKRNYVISIFLYMITASCTHQVMTYTTFSDWDKSRDSSLDRREFVQAYINQDYFKKWSPRGNSITYQFLFEEAFESLDHNKNGLIEETEFNHHIKRLYFGLFNGSFNTWDDNNDLSIGKEEFMKHVADSKLASMWDSNEDNRISENEMAGGMFYVGDADNNGKISESELNTWKQSRQ